MAEHITIAGKRLETAWHGPEPDQAATLIFLHEGLGCVSLWRDFPKKLAAATGCGALVYSRLGYGGSDPCALPRPLDFMHDEGLRVLPQLIEQLGIQRCILIGHSDGGSIALIYAGGANQAPLRGVITEAAHVFVEPLTLQSIRQAKTAYAQTDLRKKLMKHHGPNVDCAFRGWNDVWLHPKFAEWHIQDVLPRIRVPVLAIQGEDDEYGTQNQIQTIENLVPADVTALLVPDCGHAPHKDQQATTLTAMTGFIRSLL